MYTRHVIVSPLFFAMRDDIDVVASIERSANCCDVVTFVLEAAGEVGGEEMLVRGVGVGWKGVNCML
jgi:hypothetical protein